MDTMSKEIFQADTRGFEDVALDNVLTHELISLNWIGEVSDQKTAELLGLSVADYQHLLHQLHKIIQMNTKRKEDAIEKV